MTPSRLRSVTIAVLVLGALGTLTTIALTAGSSAFTFDVIGFVVWSLVPYPGLALLTERMGSRGGRLAGLVGALAIGAGAGAFYAVTFWLDTPTMGSLLWAFLFLPGVQIAAAMVTAGVAALLNRRDAGPEGVSPQP